MRDVVNPELAPADPRRMAQLHHRLASVPQVQVTQDLKAAIADSVSYLGSDATQRSIEADIYWPKWHSPWWHMLLLYELGEARRIPDRAVRKMIDGLNALPLKIFPIHPEEAQGFELWRHSACHCALGSIYQVLAACGVEVDAVLPWIKPWFVRYQMADGGLTCDDAAYLVKHECPSSMVGTIAAFEAMLLGPWTSEQQTFLDRAAGFLIERQLMLGSPTAHNAAEREAQTTWLAPCFPRFYFYDVLRGLTALLEWAERSGRAIPLSAVAAVSEHLVAAFPDGVIRLQRQGMASCPTTRILTGSRAGERQPTTWFPLLDAASAIGTPCAVSSQKWSVARRRLLHLASRAELRTARV